MRVATAQFDNRAARSPRTDLLLLALAKHM
jgi:hypothetical protein